MFGVYFIKNHKPVILWINFPRVLLMMFASKLLQLSNYRVWLTEFTLELCCWLNDNYQKKKSEMQQSEKVLQSQFKCVEIEFYRHVYL